VYFNKVHLYFYTAARLLQWPNGYKRIAVSTLPVVDKKPYQCLLSKI